MTAIHHTARVKDKRLLELPEEAEALGLKPGDAVQVHLEATNGAASTERSDQAALQARFERFFENVDKLTFEEPTKFPAGDPAEAAFTEAMDEKFRRLGFKS